MVSIRAIQNAGRAVTQCFRTRTVSAESKNLFSFAKRHPLKTSGQELNEDGMLLTHLGDFLPRDGYIDTARSAIGASRDSVHFAVNHAVTSHLGGSWVDKKFAYLIPMRAARASGENTFVGGIASDFYSHGRVKIPEGAIIVRRTESIKPGKFRISDASKIDEFKDLHGVKVIETSNPNMKAAVDTILQKLGYNLQNMDDVFDMGENFDCLIFKNMKLFSRFLTKNGMKPMFHTYTPNGKMDLLLMNLDLRANLNKGWQFVKDGEVLVDTRKNMLDALKYLDDYAKKYNYPLDFDINKLAAIIQKAATPKEAVNLIKSEMKISSFVNKEALDYCTELSDAKAERILYTYFRCLVDSPGLRKFDIAASRYAAAPSERTYRVINSLINRCNTCPEKSGIIDADTMAKLESCT